MMMTERKAVFVEVRVVPLCGGHGYQKAGVRISELHTLDALGTQRFRFWTIGMYQKELIIRKKEKKSFK